MSEAKHTPGPWKIVEQRHPHWNGRAHVERRIFTAWDHPQMKGPAPVVGLSIGIGLEYGGPAIRFTSIDEADARLLDAAPDLLDAAETAKRHIDDLVALYAPEHTESERVKEAQERIHVVGMLFASATVLDTLRAAIARATGTP